MSGISSSELKVSDGVINIFINSIAYFLDPSISIEILSIHDIVSNFGLMTFTNISSKVSITYSLTLIIVVNSSSLDEVKSSFIRNQNNLVSAVDNGAFIIELTSSSSKSNITTMANIQTIGSLAIIQPVTVTLISQAPSFFPTNIPSIEVLFNSSDSDLKSLVISISVSCLMLMIIILSSYYLYKYYKRRKYFKFSRVYIKGEQDIDKLLDGVVRKLKKIERQRLRQFMREETKTIEFH